MPAQPDGAYCHGAGYLAFELQMVDAPSPPKRHGIRIVRFGTAQGLAASGEVRLDDFRPTALVCDVREVRIAGWGEHGYVAYRVDISSPAPTIRERVADQHRPFTPEDTGLPTIGELARPGVVMLDGDEEGWVELQIAVGNRQVAGRVRHEVTARLLRRNSIGTITRRLVLLQRSFLETID